MEKTTDLPYRWVQNNMLLERDITPWSAGYLVGEGKADALLRTGRGAIAYNGTEKGDNFLEGVKSCFKPDGKGGYHAWRYPVDEDNGTFSGLPAPHLGPTPFDSVSRDQTIMAFIALAALGRQDLVKEYHSGLKWRLSPIFTQTVDYWLWAKAVGGNWFWTQIFWILSTILMTGNILWNKFIFWIGGLARKGDPVNFYGELPPDHEYTWEFTKLDNLIYKAQYPHFAFVQFTLQMYVLPKHPMKTYLQWLCKFNRFKHNLLVRLALGEEVAQDEIDAYVPHYGMRWNNRMNITSRANQEAIRPEHDSEFNYDKDILYGLNRLSGK